MGGLTVIGRTNVFVHIAVTLLGLGNKEITVASNQSISQNIT